MWTLSPGGRRRRRTVGRRAAGRPLGGTIGDRTGCRVHAKLTAPGRERERRRAGGGREKAGGRRAAGGCVAAAAWRPWRPGRAAAAGLRHAAPRPSTRTRLATTHSWSVHYASNSTESKETLVESGDAGPASASQTVPMGKGSISILVIGGISYVKGNVGGLESLAGPQLIPGGRGRRASGSSSRPTTRPSPRWSTGSAPRTWPRSWRSRPRSPSGTPARSTGRRSTPSTGPRPSVKKSQHVVLYVRAKGTHVPVEEDSVNAKGQPPPPSTSSIPGGASRCGPRRPRRPSPSARSAPSKTGARRPVRPAGVGRWGPSPPWPSRRSPRHRAGPPGE